LIHVAFLEVVDNLCLLSPPEKLQHQKKQLLIIRPDGIGDFIIFLNSLKRYREIYPAGEWEITLLGNHNWADLARGLPYADTYWFLDRKRFDRQFSYRCRVLNKVREAGFDTVIHPVFSREYYYGDVLLKASGAKERIGSEGDLTNISLMRKRRSDRWYTRLIPQLDAPLPEIRRNAEFLSGLGLKESSTSPFAYPAEYLADLPDKFRLDKRYFVLAPGAGWQGKQWPGACFAELAGRLSEEEGWSPLICAGPGEEEIAKKIIASTPSLPWIDFSGMLALPQLLKILGGAEMLISNDTSAVHMAASVRCPTVCIMGGGHFGRFYPYGDLNLNRIVYKKMGCYGCNWQCIYKTVRCIQEISVDSVWREVKELSEWLKNNDEISAQQHAI